MESVQRTHTTTYNNSSLLLYSSSLEMLLLLLLRSRSRSFEKKEEAQMGQWANEKPKCQLEMELVISKRTHEDEAQRPRSLEYKFVKAP